MRPQPGGKHDEWPVPKVNGIRPVSDLDKWLPGCDSGCEYVVLGAGDEQ